MSLCFVSFGIAVSLAELLLRQFSPQYDGHNDLFQPDPQLGWRFIPEQVTSVAWANEASHYVTINESGFRDAPFSRHKPGDKTILCIGDSFVSNLAVRDKQVFTRLMEDELSNTSVLNLGVNGYGQTQALLLLQQQLDLHQTDLVVMFIYLRNDYTDNVNSSWIYPRPITTQTPPDRFEILPPNNTHSPQGSRWHSLTRSHVLSLINHTVNDLVHRWEAEPNGFRPTETTPPELYLCSNEPWEGVDQLQATMQHLLLKIRELCQLRKIPVLFVIAPTLYQVDDQSWASLLGHYGEDELKYDRTLPNTKLLEFATQHGIKMLDLLPELRRSSQTGTSLYHRREQHWTPAGNAVVADFLVRFLQSEAWPSTKPSFSIDSQAPEIE